MTLEELLVKEVEPGDFVLIRHGRRQQEFYTKTLPLLKLTIFAELNAKIKHYKIKRDRCTFTKTIIIKI